MVHLFFSLLADHMMLYGRKIKHNQILIDFAQITLAQLHFLRQLLLFHPLMMFCEDSSIEVYNRSEKESSSTTMVREMISFQH